MTEIMNIATRALAMPKDVNTQGDIFGGWVLCQMDHAGVIEASRHIDDLCKVVTVKIKEMNFIAPVKVGDVVTCHTNLVRIGNTSMDVYIKVTAQRDHNGSEDLVTEGIFTYVCISKITSRPQKIQAGVDKPLNT